MTRRDKRGEGSRWRFEEQVDGGTDGREGRENASHAPEASREGWLRCVGGEETHGGRGGRKRRHFDGNSKKKKENHARVSFVCAFFFPSPFPPFAFLSLCDDDGHVCVCGGVGGAELSIFLLMRGAKTVIL